MAETQLTGHTTAISPTERLIRSLAGLDDLQLSIVRQAVCQEYERRKLLKARHGMEGRHHRR